MRTKLAKILNNHILWSIFLFFVDVCLKKPHYNDKIASDYWIIRTERISNSNEGDGIW